MKPLVLDAASIFLQVKNKGKYFKAYENHQKGQQPLKCCFSRHLPYSLQFYQGIVGLYKSGIE